MESDITDIIADLVRRATPQLESRLEYQAEALREVECTNPALGWWVDANDVKYLLSAFALDDIDFAAKFPTMAHVTTYERQRIVAALEGHFEQCQHCSLKRGYDLEMDARIKQACRQNSGLLLQLLEKDEADSTEEGEHVGARLKAVFSARQ